MGSLCTPFLLHFAGLSELRTHKRNARTGELGERGSARPRSEERHDGQTPNMTDHHARHGEHSNILCAGKCASDNRRWLRRLHIGDQLCSNVELEGPAGSGRSPLLGGPTRSAG